MRTMITKVTTLAVGAALSALVTSAGAGGFAVGTQSGSGTGNAFAGGAAAADDASVAWYNPAGMMFLSGGKHVAGALHALNPSFEFQNQGSTGAFAAPGSGDGGDAGGWAFVPNAFFTMEINPQWRFGLALNVPFGLKTEYETGWRGRLAAIKSEIKTVNINPSVAYRLNDRVSVGFGASVQRLDAELTAFAGAPGIATLSADDTAYGYNFGLMAQVTPETRIGAAYRSSIKYDLEGTVTLSAFPAGNGPIRADLRVPDSFSFSVFHKLNPKWELMGDITWTGWSSVQQLAVFRTSGTLFQNTPLLWDDTMRYSIGANYRWSDQTKLRFGLALDETPTDDANRIARLPDEERTWLAFGVQYRVSKAGVLDFGYAHEFVKDATLNQAVPPAPGFLRGSYNVKADIFSFQYSHSF